MNKIINESLAKEKGLIIDNNYELYNKIENFYKYLFEYFLLSKIDLRKYNDKIKSSNLYFGVPHPNIGQLLSNLNEYINLEYIYILNNFYIEKISIEDINVLKQYVDKKIEINEQLLNIVKNTYKEVIKNNYCNGEYTNIKYKVFYGYINLKNAVDNDALVLKIFYSRNTIKLDDEEFIKNIKDKRDFLEKLSNEIIDEVKNKLEINCNILIEKISN